MIVRSSAAKLILCVGLMVLPQAAVAQDHPPQIMFFSGALVADLTEEMDLPGAESIPPDARKAAYEILDGADILSWSPSGLAFFAPTLFGAGSEIFNTVAGFDGSLRGLDPEQSRLAQDALDLMFVDGDFDGAALILAELVGSGAASPEAMVRGLSSSVRDHVQRLGATYAAPQDREHRIVNEATGQEVLARWDLQGGEFVLRMEDVLPQGGATDWLEISAPVTFTLHDNPVHLAAALHLEERRIRFGGSDSGEPVLPAPLDVAEGDAGGLPPDPMQVEINRLEGMLVTARCTGVLWEHSVTAERVCAREGETPAGPFQSLGPNVAVDGPAADLLAGALTPQIEQLRQVLAAMPGPSPVPDAGPAVPPPAEEDCSERRSRIVPADTAGPADGSGLLNIVCGPVQNFGGSIALDVTIPQDQFNVRDANYSDNGTYHRIVLSSAARIMRGEGVRPAHDWPRFDLRSPTSRLDLGVLAPGYYRISLYAWRELKAETWLLITVDERPGTLRLADSSAPVTKDNLSLQFEAPALTPYDEQGPPLPRYELDFVQIGEDGRPRKRTTVRHPNLEFDIHPGRAIPIPPFMLAPGDNQFTLLINDGGQRYVLDTLVLDLGGEVVEPGVFHFALNGEVRLIDADLHTATGQTNTVEMAWNGPATPLRGHAILRIHRLRPGDPHRPAARQYPHASTGDGALGEIVEEHEPKRFRALTAWTIRTPLSPGSYAASVEQVETGDRWHLFFEVIPDANAFFEIEGGDRFLRDQSITARWRIPPETHGNQSDATFRLYRLGGHVPGCARMRAKLIDPSRVAITLDPGQDGSAQMRLDTPGLYLAQLVSDSGEHEPILAERGFEVLADAEAGTWTVGTSTEPVTDRDRREAEQNPWSGVGRSFTGEDCSNTLLGTEEIALHLVAFDGEAYRDVSGPARYGTPYYLEGRLQTGARKLSYLATIGLPDGSAREVRLYRLEDQPDRLRSEILYFVWDAYAEGEP